MKKILLFFTLCISSIGVSNAQNANVSLSDIDAKNGYGAYNSSNKTITGIYFNVLSDGTNSTFVLSDFQVSLYLLPCDNSGNTTSSTPIIIKTMTVSGMQQLHGVNYTDQSADLSTAGLADGQYRLGVWVNSDPSTGIPQPPDVGADNAYLVTFNSNGSAANSIITFSSSLTGIVNSLQDLHISMSNPTSQSQLSKFVASNNFDSAEVYNLAGQLQNINSLNNNVYVIKLSKSNKLYTGKIIVE